MITPGYESINQNGCITTVRITIIMDAVNAFNVELFSMIDMKPPISRAKMMSVTKSAIKAIKLYKHVVQIVEKFIKKCKPELKVPGLYVVDSIVRQSRHQFGVDKDVFGPRFLKNFTETFHNLYCCPEDDKSKIMRVLNLWQKNGVFELDIIQPLMDMANGLVEAAPIVPYEPVKSEPQVPSVQSVSAVPHLSNVDALAAVAQLFQSPQGQELQKVLQSLHQGATADNSLPTPPQLSAVPVNTYSLHTENKNSLAEKLLDRFEYDDEPEDATGRDSAQLLNIAENVLKQFAGQLPNVHNVHPHMMGQAGAIQHDRDGLNYAMPNAVSDGYTTINEPYTREPLRDDSPVKREGRHRGYGRRSRSRSFSRSPRRRRSRSSSRSRRSRHRNTHSQSRERRGSCSVDRKERERERERRQRGLPSIKSQALSVCSTTLWVGQLDKKTQQADIMLLLEEFGQIESVNMIPPRGCAYIVMVHRQDASTALNKLSRGSFRVNQKPFKIAWAMNKGIKAAHKKFWDVDRGVTYIPWSKVKVEELESYREGGMLDTDTLNPEWGISKDFFNNQVPENVPTDGAAAVQVQASPMGSPPAIPVPVMLSPTSILAEVALSIPKEFEHAKVTPKSNLQPPDVSTTDSTQADTAPSDLDADHKLGSPGAPPMSMHSPFPGPGMSPVQPLPRMPNPNLPPFMSPPHMSPHMVRPMMPGGPMFPPDRFGMPMPFPPRGPPFQRPGMDMGPYRNGRPGFGPPFPRGRW